MYLPSPPYICPPHLECFSSLSVLSFISSFSQGDFIQIHCTKFDVCADDAQIYRVKPNLFSGFQNKIYNICLASLVGYHKHLKPKGVLQFQPCKQAPALHPLSADGCSHFSLCQVKNVGAFLILFFALHFTSNLSIYPQIMLAVP